MRCTITKIQAFAVWALLVLVPGLPAQSWDVGGKVQNALSEETGGRLKFGFEQRGRYEDRNGNSFGKDPDVATALFRTRLSLTYNSTKWLRFSATMQDSRAPLYGPNAPTNMRDTADLHEGYIELFPSYKTGFGMTAGRMMLNYGEGRLLGTPQWSNVSRSYDHARVYWRFPRFRVELLFASIVKNRCDEFNRPVLGDRLWGTYNVFPSFYRKNQLELYLFRREQNRPGGFTAGSSKDGTDRLGINTFGLRLAGPLSTSTKYSLEGALQGGMVGPAELRSGALAAMVTRHWNLGMRMLDVTAEYKYASGTSDPSDTRHSGTFDQLYAANHDRFGHQDLFGWRNIQTPRILGTLSMTKAFALNAMYNDYWLVSSRDALYNGTGKAIVRSATGTAGRHVGREADVFGTYKYGRFTVGAGFGHLFTGQFIQRTTPSVGPTYVYLFHSYTL